MLCYAFVFTCMVIMVKYRNSWYRRTPHRYFQKAPPQIYIKHAHMRTRDRVTNRTIAECGKIRTSARSVGATATARDASKGVDLQIAGVCMQWHNIRMRAVRACLPAWNLLSPHRHHVGVRKKPTKKQRLSLEIVKLNSLAFVRIGSQLQFVNCTVNQIIKNLSIMLITGLLWKRFSLNK